MTQVTEKDKSLEERVRMLEDAEAIRKLKARYAYAVDSQDSDGVMSTFAAVCSADYGPFGNYKTRDETENFFKAILPPVLPFTLHWLHNDIINVTSETAATGQWYFEVPATHEPSNRAIWIAGKYDEDYIKEKGEWKIKKMVCTFYYVTGYDEGWVKKKMTLE